MASVAIAIHLFAVTVALLVDVGELRTSPSRFILATAVVWQPLRELILKQAHRLLKLAKIYDFGVSICCETPPKRHLISLHDTHSREGLHALHGQIYVEPWVAELRVEVLAHQSRGLQAVRAPASIAGIHEEVPEGRIVMPFEDPLLPRRGLFMSCTRLYKYAFNSLYIERDS